MFATPWILEPGQFGNMDFTELLHFDALSSFCNVPLPLEGRIVMAPSPTDMVLVKSVELKAEKFNF